MKKHIPRLASIALLGFFLVACTTAGQGTDAPAPPMMDTPQGRALAAQEVLRLINVERAKIGLPPYRTDPQYMEAAQIRADQIVETEHFDHWGPNNEDVLTAALRASKAQVKDRCSEILAVSGGIDSYSGPAIAVESWIKSDRHKPIVVDAEYSFIGIGIAWASSGMDFDPGPDVNFGVGGVYVLVACLKGEAALGNEDIVQSLRDSGEGLDFLIGMREQH